MARITYLCPTTHAPLTPDAEGLVRPDGLRYRYLPAPPGVAPAPDFLDLATLGAGQRVSLGMYATDAAGQIYRNFLDWLFATFGEDEIPWRRQMTARLRLRPGDAVLVTGCGLGDDIPSILESIGPGGEVHAQDLSPEMIQLAGERWARDRPEEARRVHFSVGDALRLPFAAGALDAAFHFGGINLFGDVGAGIAEMHRVVRPGGRVVVGDEGVAPWLRDTDYGRMVVTNIPLWGSAAPIDLLPPAVSDVSLEWVLGQCFWVIGFAVAALLPEIDPHVPHKGRRGGTMWTRHHGQLEGITPETRDRVRQAAMAAGLSVHDWLEKTLGEAAQSSSSTARPKPERP